MTKAVDALVPPPGIGRIYLVFGALAIGAYYFLPSDVQSVLFVAIAASSGAAIFLGARLHLTEGRLPWYLFAAGQLAFAVGDGIFGYYEIWQGREPPFPSVADPIYLAAYPLIILGIFLLIRRHRAVEGHFAVVDATIIAVGFGLVQWVFLIEPQLHGGHRSAIEDLALIAYPAVDALLLGALARFYLAPAWRTRAYAYVMVSIVLLLMADEVYAAGPDLYIGGDWVDGLWLGSYIFWGAGALDPSMRSLSRTTEGDLDLSWGRLALMTGALLAAPTILVIEIARENRLEAFAVFAAAAVLAILVLGRGLGMDAYVFERERVIRIQQSAIRTLSAPILELRREILMVPVVGRIDPERVAVMTKHLVSSIGTTRARIVVLDMTNDVASWCGAGSRPDDGNRRARWDGLHRHRCLRRNRASPRGSQVRGGRDGHGGGPRLGPGQGRGAHGSGAGTGIGRARFDRPRCAAAEAAFIFRSCLLRAVRSVVRLLLIST